MNSNRIWIIGASHGIGRELARVFAAEGAQLILSARDRDALQRVADEIGGARIEPLDVTDRPGLEAAVGRIAQGGPVDRIIHLAALYDPGRIADLDPVRAAQIVTVNLTGSFHVAQLGVQLLTPGGSWRCAGRWRGIWACRKARSIPRPRPG